MDHVFLFLFNVLYFLGCVYTIRRMNAFTIIINNNNNNNRKYTNLIKKKEERKKAKKMKLLIRCIIYAIDTSRKIFFKKKLLFVFHYAFCTLNFSLTLFLLPCRSYYNFISFEQQNTMEVFLISTSFPVNLIIKYNNNNEIKI